MVPLGILAIVLAVLFEVYNSDFERWVKPLTDWLREREAWSWVLPTIILVILSFPPLFGHEIVQLVVGVSIQMSRTGSHVRIDSLTSSIANVSSWRCHRDCVCGRHSWRGSMLVSFDSVDAISRARNANFAEASSSSICSLGGLRRKLQHKSGGRLLLESPKKLDSGVCW
jgi:hypothetical protein